MLRLTALFNNVVYCNYLLIGLFPFFIPVFLWKQGAGISEIALFIAITGLGYVSTLIIWDRWRQRLPLLLLLASPLLFELLLLSLLFIDASPLSYLPLALINGAYNAVFWTNQRLLFSAGSDSSNHGRKFGNFQIISAIMMKIGIFIGGLLLEYYGGSGIYLLSIGIAVLSTWHLKHCIGSDDAHYRAIFSGPVLPLKQVFHFKDAHGSRSAFIADGLFLFLESYFWSITLFLIAKESFLKLGILVIMVSVFLAVLFYVIKNKIDKADTRRLFLVATVAYAGSWWLRSLPDADTSLALNTLLIASIAFTTALFRLAFNKRFFHLAQAENPLHYILAKSYISQSSMFIIYGVIALAFLGEGSGEALSTLYLAAAAFTPLYLRYAPPKLHPAAVPHVS